MRNTRKPKAHIRYFSVRFLLAGPCATQSIADWKEVLPWQIAFLNQRLTEAGLEWRDNAGTHGYDQPAGLSGDWHHKFVRVEFGAPPLEPTLEGILIPSRIKVDRIFTKHAYSRTYKEEFITLQQYFDTPRES